MVIVMNKEEIKHFKAMLRQGSLRHMNIILDDKFQSELLNIIKDYEKQQLENKKYKEVIDKAIKCVYYNTKYRNGADIYQFVDIESEILEPLQDILEQNDNSNNAYLKEFNDWLKEVE